MQDRLTRKEAKERTRQRLIDAALEHVRHSGLTGLTTGRVAEAAGIAQSSFYVHFTDMEALLQAAADKLGTEMRAVIRTERLKIDPKSDDPSGALRNTYEATINGLLAQKGFAELLLSQRRERTSPLGDTMRALLASAREDLLGDLKSFGFDTDDPLVIVQGELLIGASLTIVESVLDGRLDDPDVYLAALVNMTQGMLFPHTLHPAQS